jgi:hypothetical protein
MLADGAMHLVKGLEVPLPAEVTLLHNLAV